MNKWGILLSAICGLVTACSNGGGKADIGDSLAPREVSTRTDGSGAEGGPLDALRRELDGTRGGGDNDGTDGGKEGVKPADLPSDPRGDVVFDDPLADTGTELADSSDLPDTTAKDGGDLPDGPGDGTSDPGDVSDVADGNEDVLLPAIPPTIEIKAPVKVDLLLVVDNTSSMCQEQAALGASIGKLVEALNTFPGLDVRAAAVTTSIKDGGAFVKKTASSYAPSCIESVMHPCLANEECVAQYGPGWECKAVPAQSMENLNGSINSQCSFRCKTNLECCQEFCFLDECGGDPACLETSCIDQGCSLQCIMPGGLPTQAGCAPVPQTSFCPASLPDFLAQGQLSLLPCIANPPSDQGYNATMEQGMRTAWLALDGNGPNGAQATAFLRPEALLLLLFFSDEDDCSIDEQFCSPNYPCATNADCLAGGKCVVDEYFSELAGTEKKLCCGVIKKDYYNGCSLLGEFKGMAHHGCAYDLGCNDCDSDDDCEHGWYCKLGKKCRPEYYSFSSSACYQNPPGTPIFSLSPAEKYAVRFASLKSDPGMVFVVALVGTGLPVGDDAASLVSQACLDMEFLDGCQDYVQAKQDASPECVAQPTAAGCELLLAAKKACMADCYVAALGDQLTYENTYACAGELGTAQLGSRYFRLAEAFGPHGLIQSLCSPDAAGKAMEAVANMLKSSVVVVE